MLRAPGRPKAYLEFLKKLSDGSLIFRFSMNNGTEGLTEAIGKGLFASLQNDAALMQFIHPLNGNMFSRADPLHGHFDVRIEPTAIINQIQSRLEGIGRTVGFDFRFGVFGERNIDSMSVGAYVEARLRGQERERAMLARRREQVRQEQAWQAEVQQAQVRFVDSIVNALGGGGLPKQKPQTLDAYFPGNKSKVTDLIKALCNRISPSSKDTDTKTEPEQCPITLEKLDSNLGKRAILLISEGRATVILDDEGSIERYAHPTEASYTHDPFNRQLIEAYEIGILGDLLKKYNPEWQPQGKTPGFKR